MGNWNEAKTKVGTEGKPIARPTRLAKFRSLWFAPTLLLGAFIFVSLTVFWLIQTNTYAAKQNQLVDDAESTAESIRLRLKGNQDYLLLLAAERGDGAMNAQSFQERASRYVADHPEMICINWVDADYLITDVAPIAPNKQIVGLHLDLPEPKRASRLAMETRQPVYTHPFVVIQGDLAFELWVPVYHADVFLGLFGGIYSYGKVLDSLVSPQVLKTNNVSVVDASGKALLELPPTGIVDEKLVHQVSLTSPENGGLLQFNGYGPGVVEQSLWLLEFICLVFAIGIAYAMWRLKREIEVSKQVEEALRRLNRELCVVSNCNQTMMRAEDEQTLLNEICRIICDEAGHHLAWVGYAEHDDAKTVRPVAWAGLDNVYVESAKLSWADDTERGQGPGGTAIQSGETVCIQDFTTDPRMAPWRESALQRGYRSGIGLPLKDESANVFGVLLIYSTEISAFIPDELRLLEKLAGDLAFGIVVLRNRIKRKRAEESLRESENRYRRITEGLTDYQYSVRVENGRPVETVQSPTCIMVTGYTAEEFATDPYLWIRMVAAEDRELVRERVQQILAGKELLPIEHRICRKDGETRWVSDTTILFKDAAENLLSYDGVIKDITERKRAEEALHESERVKSELLVKLNEAQQLAMIGNWEWNLQTNHVWWSDETYQIFGVTPQAFVPSFEANGQFIHPDDLASYGESFEYSFQTGEPLDVDLRLVANNGQLKYCQAKGKIIYDDSGQPLSFIGTIMDITERKRAEEHLHEKVATLRAVAEIDREITAAMEPKGILELVCRRTAELVHTPKSAIVIRTAADEMEMAASYGLRDAARVSAEFAHTWQAGSMNPSVLKTRGVIALNEITADTRVMPDTIGAESVRALAIVPLVPGEELLGALIVLDTTPRQWQADDLQILDLLAGQTAIALEKLRLFEMARSRALYLATLNEIGQAITSLLELDRVLLTLLEKVREATQVEACSVALIEPGSGDLVFRQAVGRATQEVIGLRLPPGEGLAGWVAQHRQSVLVPDVSADARARILDGRSGFVTRDLIGVPLIARDQVTGVIELINKRSGAFSEDDRRLLESVATQAAIAIENARLFEIERTGREQLETLYRVGQAINSTLDADTILDRLTDEAMRTTRATHGSALVARPERGGFERRSLRGYSPEQVEQARADWLPLDRGINGRAYHSRRPVYVGDAQADPDYHPLILETRSELVVPILRGGQVIGNLDLQSPEVDAFHDVSLDFLQALTEQVAIALENARLFEETRRHMDERSIVSQVALVGAAGRPFDETVERATNALSRLWPDTSLGFLFVDEAGQSLRLHATYHEASPLISTTTSVPIDQGITGWAVRERQPIRVGDVSVDPRYLLTAPATRSEMAAPMVVGQRVIGVINVESPRLDAFSGDDLRLLTTLAGQLATIFEKARLDAELASHAALLEQRVAERTRELSVANEQLKELDHLKDQFVSNVSHELRTPLANLKLYLALLDRGKPEKRVEYMQTLHREQRRLDKMIEDLLDLSRLDQGVTPIQPVPAELNLLLSQLIADRSVLAAEHQLVLDYQPDDTLPLALIDPVMLTEVITNLVGNAISYTPAGGVITVITAAREQAGQTWVTFTVQDNGLGISARDLPHLFERFYRGEVGRKASAPGTGLGLAISREIVEKMGGRITVESEPGHGAAFTVWLKPAD